MKPNVECRDLWSSMTKSDKCKWFVTNKVFKFIGTYIRKKNYESNLITKAEHDVLLKLPSWAESHPKSILICDYYVYVPIPAPYINIELTIKKL